MEIDGGWYAAAAVLWVAFVGLGLYVARARGRPAAEGFWLSALFGAFGVLILALLPARRPAKLAPRPRAAMPADRWAWRPEDEAEEKAAEWLAGDRMPPPRPTRGDGPS